MVALTSPGIRVREFNFSEYVAQAGASTLAIVGGATKGPLNTPTVILNEGDLVRTFGPPLSTDYGLQTAIQFLKQGSRLVYVRIADDDAVTGAKSADAKFYGGVLASGSIAFSAKPADGDTITLLPKSAVCSIVNDNPNVGNVAITKAGSSAATILVTGMSGAVTGVAATGTILFDVVSGTSVNPVTGTTVTISDGTTATTFEFTNTTPTPGNTAVAIGSTAADTMGNLVTAINASSTLVTATNKSAGVTFEFDDNGSIVSGNVSVSLGTANTNQFQVMQSLITAINASAVFGPLSISALDNSGATPACVLLADTVGDNYNATVTKVSTAITVTGMSGGVDAGTQELVTISAANPGTWANGIQVEVTEYRDPGVIPTAATNQRALLVYASVETGAPLEVVERFDNISLDPASDRFLETMLASGIQGEVSASEYIRADVYPAGSTETVPTGVLTVGTTELGRVDLGNTTGADGISGLHGGSGYAFFVGTVNGRTSTGLKSLRNPETVEFNILACPGISHRSVIAEMANLCRSRGDSIYLVDPPLGLSPDEVVDWHNGLRSTSNGGTDATAPSAPLNDSYGGLYWGWQEIDDPYTRKTLWLPPSGFVAGLMAANDDTNGPWIAVAGKVRGVITGTNRGEYSPDRDERELLVGGTNRVNPIPSFADAGWTVYGNRTLSRLNSALNSMHIRRMLIHAEKVCAAAVSYLVFDPNDPQTWAAFTRLCNTELSSIAARRGLASFRVICDESTNPPAQRQQKTMRGKLLLEPIEAAEIILLDFAVYASGASFNENF